MKTFNLTFDGLVDSQYGKKAVWHSKSKPEPKQKSIQEGLDLSHLEVGKTYSVTMDENNYWTVTGVAEPTAFTGKREYSKPYDVRQAVSNAIAAAITAGKIEHPGEIEAWAQATWQAVNGVGGEEKVESPAESKEESVDEGAYPEGPWVCPNCDQKKVGKSKYGPQWYCFACKAKYAKDAPEITGQFGGESSPPPKDTGDEEIPF